jgi:hypothetical protein
MSKNYSLDYWSALLSALTKEKDDVETMVEKVDTGEPTTITEGRQQVGDYIVFIINRLAKMHDDIRRMKFEDFNEAYLD